MTVFEEPADVKIFDGFRDMTEAESGGTLRFPESCDDIQGFLTYPELF